MVARTRLNVTLCIYCLTCCNCPRFCFLGAISPYWDLAPSFTRICVVSRLHTTSHHSRQDSSGRVNSSSQRPLPDNTQQTNINAPGGIRTHELSRRAAVDLRLRPRGHWDRQLPSFLFSWRYNPLWGCILQPSSGL